MGLNDLRLPPAVLSRLYPTLVIPGESGEAQRQTQVANPIQSQKIPETPSPTAWKYLGNNQQKILVVVNYRDAVHLPDEELSFLTSMLAACKLSLGDVAIINRNNFQNVPYKEILSHFQSRIVFLFGIEPAEFGLPVSFPSYQVQSLANVTFLYTAALEERHTDPLLKSKLWVCLRNIFSI